MDLSPFLFAYPVSAVKMKTALLFYDYRFWGNKTF